MIPEWLLHPLAVAGIVAIFIFTIDLYRLAGKANAADRAEYERQARQAKGFLNDESI